MKTTITATRQSAEGEQVDRQAVVFIPTREDIESLKVGDPALDAFGRWSPVKMIFAAGTNVRGGAYVCFYTKTSETSHCSQSYHEGGLVRTVDLCSAFTSAELDQIEKDFNAKGTS